MTITKYDGFAIIPKRCDKCNRLFWLEPYNVFYKEVGIGHYSLKQIECKECMKCADIIDQARAIKEYCRDRRYCDECRYNNEETNSCRLHGTIPIDWDLPEGEKE